MELTKIKEIMSSVGYTNFIDSIFSKWEYVKDEILLPNRKTGSGNGCVHVYLLEDNMEIFRLCFPDYCKKIAEGESIQESDCPVVDHFVMTSNLLTVGGFAYHYYDCDLVKFNYSNFANKVLREDDNGLISFKSLFKLSTDNRPYFKQFDRYVFGQIVRYTFIPKRTAYKLYMFSDNSKQHYAVFWIIGQIPEKSFIIEKGYQDLNSTPLNNEHSLCDPLSKHDKEKSKASVFDLMRTKFENYMRSKNKSDRTVIRYVSNLNILVPRAQKMIDGRTHPSPLTITDYQTLVELDNSLWNNPKVYNWNKKTHNNASAALHMYMEMIKNTSIDDVSDEKNEDIPEEASTVKAKDKKEKVIIEEYFTFLFKEKNITEKTAFVYKGQIQNKLTGIINDFYNTSYEDLFDLDFKTLVSIEEDLEEIPQVLSMNKNSRRLLQAAFRSYVEFRESRLTDEELAQLAFG